MKNRIITCLCISVLYFAPLLAFGQVPPTPVITGFSPTAQCSGGTVTIVGRNFVNVQAVRFGGVNARNFAINTTGDSIRAILGSGATGQITVQTTIATATSATNFTFLGSSGPYVGMRIRDVRPFPIAARDSSVETTLIGDFVRDCANTGGVVILSKQVGDSLLTESFTPLIIPSPRERRFTIPAAFVRTPGNIRCYFDDRTTGAYTTTLTITVPQSLPPITSIVPNSTISTRQAFQIVINGQGFFGDMKIQFAGVTLSTISTSATRIVANVPATLNEGGRWEITVTTPDGKIAVSAMTISPYPGVPVIENIVAQPPLSRPIPATDIVMTIIGIEFFPNLSVSLGLYRVNVVSVSQNRVVAVIPSTIATLLNNSNAVNVIVQNQDGTFATRLLIIGTTSVAKNNAQHPLYPNPANETVTLETNNPTPRTVTLILRNTLGQELMRLTEEMPAGRVLTPLEVGRFPAGTYFLEMQSGSERVVERLVKY